MITKRDGKMERHPGYYWLAYRWENLLPTCARCNRVSVLTDGRRVGKGTRFPVQGNHSWEPHQKQHEQPLFIHPVCDQPAEHIGFDVATGLLIANTPRGAATIELLDLNRERMPEERLLRYNGVKAQFLWAHGALQHGQEETFRAVKTVFEGFRRGEGELSLAARVALEEEGRRMKQMLQLVGE